MSVTPSNPFAGRPLLAPLSPSAAVAGLGCRVLVVEDDPSLLGMMDLLLRHYAFEIHAAPTLADARRQLSAGDPDVVVLDLNLPDGNGVDLLEHLRATGRRARVIVQTAGSSPEHLQRLRFLRPDRVLIKPMNFLDLLMAIRSSATADVATGLPVRPVAGGVVLGT